MKTKALVIIAHGSRRKKSNRDFLKLVDKIKLSAEKSYPHVEPAFLEFASPSFAETIDQLVEEKVKKVFVFPYFLNSGNHVERDIPNLIQTALEKHPSCHIEILPAFGKLPGIETLIFQQIQKSINESHSH